MRFRQLLSGLLLSIAVAGCAAQNAFYVERPLLRTPLSNVDTPSPPARIEPPRLPRVASVSLANRMVARVVTRPGTRLVSLVYVNPLARLGADYLPTFLGDALLAGARRADGTAVYPVAIDGEAPRVITGMSGTTISVTCAAQRFDEALELLAALVQRPLFDQTWMAPVRSRTALDLIGVRSRYRDWSLATEHDGEPFVLDEEAVAEALHDVGQPALARAYRALFRPENSALIVVGDVPPPRAFAAFDRLFSGWVASPQEPDDAAGALPVPPAPVTGSPERTRKIIVDEDSGYPHLTIIQNAPALESTDAIPFGLLLGILASNPSSTLMKTLRSRQAHAYYVGTRTVSVPLRGRYFFLETAVAQETLTQDLSEMLRTLDKFRTATIDEASLVAAKARFNAGLAARLSSGRGVAEYLASVELRNSIPFEGIEAAVEATTANDLRRVAARYLDPDRATIALTGAVAKSLPALAKLGVISKR